MVKRGHFRSLHFFRRAQKGGHFCSLHFFVTQKRAQYKIQQMAFMILAIFFFFSLVGLFFISWQFSNLKSDFSVLQEEKIAGYNKLPT